MSTDFYSVDKLIEFGLPANAANEMINSMNQVFNKMKTPGVDITPNVENTWTEDLYYAVVDGKESGPYSMKEVVRLIVDKKITQESYIWRPGMRDWDYARNFPEIVRLIAIAPPKVPPMGIVPVK